MSFRTISFVMLSAAMTVVFSLNVNAWGQSSYKYKQHWSASSNDGYRDMYSRDQMYVRGRHATSATPVVPRMTPVRYPAVYAQPAQRYAYPTRPVMRGQSTAPENKPTRLPPADSSTANAPWRKDVDPRDGHGGATRTASLPTPPVIPFPPAAAIKPAATRPILGPAQPGEHPLTPALKWAKSGLKDIEKISDYSATMVKRERIDGELGELQHMFVKVRHNPFSVYMCFLKPKEFNGQEVIYVDGQNDGNMFAHALGLKAMFGTVSLSPTGAMAMKGQRYPLTELGLKNMTRRLVNVASEDMKYGECEVKYYKGAKINGRVCTCVEVVHSVPRRNFLFYKARIFVDNEMNVPIRFESYGWPKEPGDRAPLQEEYTYVNIKLNQGFSDIDFDVKNPKYAFPQ